MDKSFHKGFSQLSSSSALALETSVLQLLEKHKIPYEQRPIKIRIATYYPDAILPRGFADLIAKGEDYPQDGCTVLEIKLRLLFDTVKRLYNKFQEIKETEGINVCNFVLVYKESTFGKDEIDRIKNELKNQHFYVFSYEEFCLLISQDETTPTDSTSVYDAKEEDKNEILLQKASADFKKGRGTLFLGAGVSVDAGIPKWDGLLKNLLQETHKVQKRSVSAYLKEIKSICANSSIVIGRYIRLLFNLKADDVSFKDKVRQSLYGSKNPQTSSLVKAISHLLSSQKVVSVVTYNYDDIIENSNSGICYPVFRMNTPQDLIPIYHVHGYVPSAPSTSSYLSTPILSEETYHKMYAEAFNWANVEQLHALNRNTCFFIGLSMTDPNLRRLLDISHASSEGNPRHYVFLKKQTYSKSKKRQPQEEQIQEEMYNELGLNVIWFNDFPDLPSLISKLP